MLSRLIALIVLALLQSACSLDPVFAPQTPAPDYPSSPTPPPEAQTYPQPPPPPTPEPAPVPAETPPAPTVEASPAVIALMQQAESDRQQGDLERAATRLERALRIQPRNPELWHHLARLRLEQHQPRLAEELAKKSISLASGDKDLLRGNWRLIAQARRLNSDPSGAREAERQAARY
ncbi:tetratricopeptide repeat protein [Methylohalobius crimeensis]|uniref:tetratricopeptide repeat protein n=1 Tax=Methylohalobius crimeensis TaxID=244365 RepID=UPI0003F6894D|nr:tetratricopeptide repeat protein [Methylohalobius crimeensis]